MKMSESGNPAALSRLAAASATGVVAPVVESGLDFDELLVYGPGKLAIGLGRSRLTVKRARRQRKRDSRSM